MEFDEKKRQPAEENKEKFSKDAIEIAYDFAKHMKKEFGDFIKALVLFGSSAKRQERRGSDIDILVIVDDLSIELSAEMVESYRLITEKIIGSVSQRLHITSLKYVTFWEYVREAHPVAVNVLREGVPILDTGFIAPLQQLLHRGQIKPSVESMFQYFARSSDALVAAKHSTLQAAMDLYWAVIDAAQSILMMHDVIPPSPEHVADLIEKILLPKNVLKHHHVAVVKEFYTLSRIISHDELKYLSGKDFDGYYKKAYDFVSDVKEALEKEAADKQKEKR
ncbi:MAG: nucleotidyltransferase domain-containing protein [Nanoarchaeota archaeon]